MNIKRAKEEIEHTVKSLPAGAMPGRIRHPAIRQRPILPMGPPGMGKTQVMEQVARECGGAGGLHHHPPHPPERVCPSSASAIMAAKMSRDRIHHERSSPASTPKMEATSASEAFLFIDEINCVSETLAPTMLQFLMQDLGNQDVPAGCDCGGRQPTGI